MPTMQLWTRILRYTQSNSYNILTFTMYGYELEFCSSIHLIWEFRCRVFVVPEMLAISFWYLVNSTEFLCRISVILVSSIKVVKKVDLSNTKNLCDSDVKVSVGNSLVCHGVIMSPYADIMWRLNVHALVELRKGDKKDHLYNYIRLSDPLWRLVI